MSDKPRDNQDAKPSGSPYTASHWQLMSRRFKRHRLAVWSLWVVIVLYGTSLFCEFVAPATLDQRDIEYSYAPPQRIHFFSDDGFHLRPFVYALKAGRHPETLERVYEEDRSQMLPLRFLVRGEPYRMWGLFESDIHLFGVEEGMVYLLGADRLGRDLFSRIIYGARISLTVGLVGVLLSFFLGLTIGCISGYYGGFIDNIIQRIIEVLRSFPAIPMWMALAASLPRSWSSLQVYIGITIVLAFIGWTGLARQVRGKILAARDEDFVVAARLGGASEGRIMFRHLLPSLMSHVIVSLTLAVPWMILGETALSFLGLGLRPPITSWGVLLEDCQSVQAVELQPWLLTPVVFVIITVLAFNFVGDGLRDAADPYAK